MKVKILSRNPDHYLRETKQEQHRVPRNYDPSVHPFEAPREYVRALNATKLERMFAKPFIGSLDGHRDGVSCVVKHPKNLSLLASGAYDGEIRLWNLPQRKCTRNFVAHDGVIRGVTFVPDGDRFLTVSDNCIKTWKTDNPLDREDDEPINTILCKNSVTGITHHRKNAVFATCGDVCQIWEEDRNEPVRSFQWGVDSLHDVKFNPVQSNLLSACASDRSIILYDMREIGPVRKLLMKLRTNRLCWNPMEAFIFTCANDDYNLYTFDTRKMRFPLYVHRDHTSAVTDIDYAPTGKEFVSGSYDKSLRIYDMHKEHSRDIYYTKRMQRLTSVQWSLDNKYIMSGSDEMNIRIWKARASEKMGPLQPREKLALDYSEALKEKFAAHPKIKRIARHRHVPSHIYNAQREHRTIRDKAKRKEANVRAHSKKGTVPFVPEKKKHVLREEK